MDFDIVDNWLPLEIHPDTPLKGKELTSMFPKSQMEAMMNNLRLYGKSYGLEFSSLSLLSNSHLSLLAGEFAKENGKLQAYNETVFKAYFSDNKDIGDNIVIEELLSNINLNPVNFAAALAQGKYEPELKRTQEEASIFGIQSTPTFIINNKFAIVGAQPINAFKEALINIGKGI
jgi:predicted DsbA family dithiol-disulfide isomerase